MSGFNNPNSFKVHTRTINYRDLVLKQWGPSFSQPDICYKFSNGRKFQSSDNATSGIYKKK